MNCRYVQSRLSAYLDVELSGAEQQQIRSHLEQCIECSCELESLRRTKQLLRQMPIVVPSSGPEHLLLRVRHSTHAPRRATVFTWRAPRWWQFAGGFALAAAIILWNQPESSLLTFSQARSHVRNVDALTSANFTASSPIFIPVSSPDLLSTHRSPSLLLFRRSVNPITEPALMPSVSYPVDPLLGYQPTSDWSGVAAEPIMVEIQR
ncbi:MAG: anti-sigma factor [Fimbriimonadales bacterium]|nr:anti-sigma factor [Fimbriimonadales bacterium]